MAKVSHGTRDKGTVSDCLCGQPDILCGFSPAPVSSDRAFWTGLPAKTAAALVADAEAACTGDWPVLSAHAYRSFSLTGDRAGYEAGYFARRRRLNALALGELVEAKGRFVDALIDGIVLIAEESGWQLPAHNGYARDARPAPLPDPAQPVIDLFAAETGAQLAVIASVLGDTLDAACPGLVARIDHEIETRITRPYLARHFWWMGHDGGKMINWTPWCTQNVLLASFTRPTDQKTRRAVLAEAGFGLDAFLAEYEEDGACDEGAFYYRHAALCLYGALSVMDAVAPNAIAPLWRSPKIRNMAEYALFAHIAGDTYINFADASAVLPPSGAREFLFGKKVGSDALCALAASDFARDERPDQPEETNLFYRLLALTTASEIAKFSGRRIETPDIYYPSCGLFIARDARFVLAAKAGDNDEGGHNHNDVGSVTLYVDGKPLLIDVGVETYTQKTFSPERYQIWTMQSAWHNLPSFEGIGENAGASFAARDVSVDLDGETPNIAMEIAGAYPPEAGVSSYRRMVRLTKGKNVEIVDTHVGSRKAELSLMFSEKPALSDGRIGVGALATIEIAGAGAMRMEEIAITDPRLEEAWHDRIYRVLVPLAANELRLTLTAGEANR